MLAFIVRRALQALGVLFAVGLIAFSMFRFAGDPVNQIVGVDTPPEERVQIRKSLGLERYDEGEITAKLEAAGFTVQRAASNIGHNAKRMTFLAHAR